MDKNESLAIVRRFFVEKSAPSQALCHLRPGHEMRLLLEGREECALFYDDGQVKVEKRIAHRPEIEFIIGSEAIRLMTEHPGDKVSQLGIDIIKEILVGHVQLRVCGSMTRLLTGGYLGIISSGGPEFIAYLKSRGIQGISKIIQTIRSFKK